jgi:membrane associated rhomboid family serine protease
LALTLCLAGFLVQGLTGRVPAVLLYTAPDGAMSSLPDPLTFLLAIHGRGLAHGFFWTPVTYLFLHGSWSHLLLNAVGLWVMGNAIEALFGSRRFWTVFLVSGVVGGVGWALAQGLDSGMPCVGASAGVLGFVGAYAALRPRDRFLLVFPFPVALSARALALWLAVANAIDLAFGHGNIAYLAHLGGLLAGALYGLALHGGWAPRRLAAWRWRDLRPSARPRTLDDVLDTIRRHGMGRLSESDRRILKEASRRGLEGYPRRDA